MRDWGMIDRYRDRKALLNWDEDDTKEGRHANKEVNLIQLPDVVSGGNINEANDCSNDDSSKHNVGGVGEQWHEEEERHHHRQSHHYVGHCSLASGIVVHGRTGEGS